MPKKPAGRPIIKINDWSDLYKNPTPGCSKEPERLYYTMAKTNKTSKTTVEPKKRGRGRPPKQVVKIPVNLRRSQRLSGQEQDQDVNVSSSRDSSNEEESPNPSNSTDSEWFVGKVTGSKMIKKVYKKSPPRVMTPKAALPPKVVLPVIPETHTKVHLGSECKNKGEIMNWLTDNQNEFDRLTQTQKQELNEEIVYSLDMPSVSQLGNTASKSTFNFKIKRSRNRDELRKFRAKSLEVRVEKTPTNFNHQRHSLAGDTPSMENYHIEECITQDDNVNTSAKIDALHLMEDEFLDTIEEKVEKANQTGWDRIKAITRNFDAMHPKQLKVVLMKAYGVNTDEIMTNNIEAEEQGEHEKDQTENENQLDNQKLDDRQQLEDKVASGNSYCGDAVEQFFSKTLVKMMSEASIIETSQPDLMPVEAEDKPEDPIEEFGKFLEGNEPELDLGAECEKLIKKLSANFDMLIQTRDTRFNQLLQELSELRSRFVKYSTATVQTSHREVSHSGVQTVPIAKADVDVQTERATQLNVHVQTEELAKIDTTAQTEERPKISVDVQTQASVEAEGSTPIEVRAEDSNDREKLDVVVRPAEQLKTASASNCKERGDDVNEVISIKSTPDALPVADRCVLAGTLDYFDDFETEDLLQKFDKAHGITSDASDQPNEITVVAQINGVSQNVTERGTKRSQKVLDDGSQEIGRTKKRPCLQFIKDDISVIFDSDSDDDDDAGVIERPVQQKQADDGFNYDVYLEEILQKYNSEGMRIESPPRKKRTQEVIEDCEMMIANMNKPPPPPQKPAVDKPPLSPPQKIEPSKPQSDPFSNDEIFIDKQNLSIIERVMDGLDHIEAAENQTLVEDKHDKSVNLSKSRKRLFDKSNNKETEVMFTGGEVTVLSDDESRYITVANDNFEKILREINGDNYSLHESETDEEIVSATQSTINKKIKVLSNVIVQTAGGPAEDDDEAMEISSNDSFTSDVVDTTPQKPKISVVRSYNSSRLDPVMDIILPPPPEFETFTEDERPLPPPLHPTPAGKTKVTSTPRTQKPNFSESIFEDMSPIISTLQSESQKTLGPIELARQSKTSTLTIITKPTCLPTQRPRPELKQQSLLAYAQRQRCSQNSNASQRTASQTSQKTVSQRSNGSSERLFSQKSSGGSSLQLSPKKLVYVISSRLSKEQNSGITRLVTKRLVQYSSMFDSKSTHLIVSVDADGRLSDCTMKYMMAVAAGLWVLKFGWVEECLATNRIAPETPYEVLDVHGYDGARRSRILRGSKPLLKDFRVYCVPTFVSASVDDVMQLIRMLGGEVVEQLAEFKENSNRYSLILAEAKLTPDVELHETWLDIYQVISVELEWLVRSVGKYDVVNVRPYLLCSDDYICDLRYPLQLTEPVSLSTQN